MDLGDAAPPVSRNPKPMFDRSHSGNQLAPVVVGPAHLFFASPNPFSERQSGAGYGVAQIRADDARAG